MQEVCLLLALLLFSIENCSSLFIWPSPVEPDKYALHQASTTAVAVVVVEKTTISNFPWPPSHKISANRTTILLSQSNQAYNKNENVNNSNNAYNWHVLSLSLFSITGAFGNILVCMTIRRDPALQTKTNYYLFSLAIADLAVCLLVIPFSIIQDFSDEWMFSPLLCTFWIFAGNYDQIRSKQKIFLLTDLILFF